MLEELCEEAIAAVREAGELILRYYREGEYQVTLKEDRSPLTSADMAAHELLAGRLGALGPYPVLSEEDPLPYERRRGWERFWLVDPLDGTKDFIERTGDFTVNAALIENGAPLCGVVGIPAQRTLYFAVRGGGAFRESAGRRERIRCALGRSSLICAVSRFHCSQATLDFCSRNGIQERRPFGSALKLCRVADGGADVYPRLSPTKEWDVAAGHIIINEAGGAVVSARSGEELRYNKESLVNDDFVARRGDLSFV